MREKMKAAGIHLLMSVLIISFVFCLIYFVWYPAPFYEESGGRRLIEIIFGVDLVLGPLLTLIVFNKNKSLKTNLWDVAVIACFQMFALGYGVNSVFKARPVFVAFEYDRFTVVHANDIDPAQIFSGQTVFPGGLPVCGPELLGVKRPVDESDKLNSMMQSLGGTTAAAQPMLWDFYEKLSPEIIAKSKNVKFLMEKFPNRVTDIASILRKNNINEKNAIFIPMAIKNSFWTVIFDVSNLNRPYYINIDSFE